MFFWRKKSIYSLFDPLPFQTKGWSADQAHLNYANCYTYALGDVGLATLFSKSMGNPGTFADAHVAPNDLQEMIDLSEADGLTWTAQKIAPKTGHYPIALFATADSQLFSYHWARLNDDGTWSEKQFTQAPHMTRHGLGDITDGEEIRNKAYSFIDQRVGRACIRTMIFAGFFNVPRDLHLSPEKLHKCMNGYEENLQMHSHVVLGQTPRSLSAIAEDLKPHRNALLAKIHSNESQLIPMA